MERVICKSDEGRDGCCQECGASMPPVCSACGDDNYRSAKPSELSGDKLPNRLSTTLNWTGPPPPTASVRSSAERRQLTIMMCDLVGSTELAARLDPEDLRDIIAAYRDQVTAIVRKYEGSVSRYVGDGALVLFGYPTAHEDDGERAVRAALEISAAASPGGALAIPVRIGIATGLVIVGDLVGNEAVEERAVVGETPNLAARLQGLAPPNGVMIAESTRQLVGGLFHYDDLGAVE